MGGKTYSSCRFYSPSLLAGLWPATEIEARTSTARRHRSQEEQQWVNRPDCMTIHMMDLPVNCVWSGPCHCIRKSGKKKESSTKPHCNTLCKVNLPVQGEESKSPSLLHAKGSYSSLLTYIASFSAGLKPQVFLVREAALIAPLGGTAHTVGSCCCLRHKLQCTLPVSGEVEKFLTIFPCSSPASHKGHVSWQDDHFIMWW